MGIGQRLLTILNKIGDGIDEPNITGYNSF